jgi:uncharacterized membrane protein YsdA (DUF1294 family)
MTRRSGLVVLVITAAAAAVLWAAGVPLGWAWLLAVNATAFFTYGYDKWIASARPHSLRIPEAVLLGLALGGGTPSAFAGMRLFHHKTAKASFLTRFMWIAAGQGLILLIYFIWGR